MSDQVSTNIDNVTLSILAGFLPDATNINILPDFDALFLRKFELALEKDQSPAITMYSYKKMYQRSPIFRRLFNFAIEMPGDKYRIKITSTISPQVNMNKKQIKLPDENIIALVPQYINLAGESVEFSPERIYLHEMLHVLSDLDDPLRGVPRVFNRGPIVYLTERILFEAGQVSQGRLCYQISLGDDTQSAFASSLAVLEEEAMASSASEISAPSNNLPWYTDPTTIGAAGDDRKISYTSSHYATASSNSSAPIQLEKLMSRSYIPPGPLKRPDIRNLVIRKIIAEDLALDKELAKGVNNSDFKLTGDTVILSEKLGDQNTVVNVLRYRSSFVRSNQLHALYTGRKFHNLFNSNFIDTNNSSSSNLFKISKKCLLCSPYNLRTKIKDILENCYNLSPTFRNLLLRRKLSLSVKSQRIQWSFVLDTEYNEDYLIKDASCIRVHQNRHLIILYNHEAFAYLGETGIQPLSAERQSVSALVAMCVRDAKFPANTLNTTDVERGITVYLSNQILHEAGYREPIQLTRDFLPLFVLAGEKDERLLMKMRERWKDAYRALLKATEDRLLYQQNILLAKTTNARRVAEIQDHYLATLVTN